MKLISVTLPSKNVPMLGSLSSITIDQPPAHLSGFRIAVRGPVVFLISPPGWSREHPRPLWRPDGPARTFEFARAECSLVWEGDNVDAVTKADTAPMSTAEERQRAVAEAADVVAKAAAQKKVA